MTVTIEELPRHPMAVAAGKRIYRLSIHYERTTEPPFHSRFEIDERYKLRGFLGSGTFALVCLGTDISNGEEVAIKKLENIFRDSLYTERAVREMVIHSQITHPFVVTLKGIMRPVHEYIFKDIYLVMERMEQTLHRRLVKEAEQHGSGVDGQVPRDFNVKLIMNQILRGIQYLHSANVLHRDLKPSNILVNGDQRAKLCDFGLARITAPDMTQKVVSAPYRPPELFLRQISDQSNYGPAVDIWSLGCIFADMLLGRPMSLGFLNAKDDITNIVKIAQTVAPPENDEELLDFIDSEAGLLFVKTKLPRSPSRPLSDIFRHVADKSAVDLLEKMLVFHPGKRISIADALQHEYMAEMTVEVLARTLNLKPSEVEKLNNVNPPPIEMKVKSPLNSTKRDYLKSIFDACVNFRPGH